ncbi:MAG TPA: metal ABC transporter permease [Lentimicrobium sp.]|nr:metal ABC transporter permease [Lentimicrobium sp.]
MIEEIVALFEYRFFNYAIIAAILASVACGIIGSYIVAKRMVFISGGITHASFGGIGIAYFFGVNPILGAALFSILSGLGIEWASMKSNIREDSAIGILWSFGMALGIIFIFLTPGYAPNLMSYLFGSILTVSVFDLWSIAILAVCLIFIFFFFYHLILFVAFDEEYARSHNIPVDGIKYLIISIIAITIVLNIRLVGIILVISFLTIPQSTANIFTQKFSSIILLSIFFSVVGSIGGLFISYFYNIPSGATIIFVFVILFAMSKLIKAVMIRSSLKKQISLIK